MTEQQSLTIARQFLVERGIDPTNRSLKAFHFTREHYEREKAEGRFPQRPGFWENFMTQYRDHWSVSLDAKRPEGVSPAQAFVIIDDETGKARFDEVI
jgi:hypothetical protein